MSFIREHVTKRFRRSSKWPKVRKAFLKKNKRCAVCGRKLSLEVHHIRDFSTNPEIELDENNLVTLCDGATRCHFTFGHLGHWKSINPTLRVDLKIWSEKFRNRRKR